MEIKDYLTMARRWAWLLVTGLILGAVGGFLGSIFQTPVYQASTRVLVLRASQADKNTDTYLSDQQLVQTYIQLLTTRPVLEGASNLLGYSVSPSQITVGQISTMQAIKLTVEDADPQRAADIANTLVQVLIQQNEAIQTGRYTLTEQSIQAQITQVENQIAQMGTEIENVSTETVQQQLMQVEAQIATMQAEVTQLENDIRALTPSTTTNEQQFLTNEQQTLLSEKEARLNQIKPVLSLSQQIYTDLVVLGKPSQTEDGTSRLSQLQTTLKLYQEIYINLLNNLEAIRLARLQNTPNVVSIEAAIVPVKPVRPKPVTNTGLAAVVGLMLAGGVAFLIEYLDDTVRTPEDVERILKLPIIGYIGDISISKGEAVDMHVLKHPRSPVSEAFRSLRTNLEFTNVDRSLNKILVASSGPGEGKSTIASNLAAIIAQGGKRVLLIDADMRRPRIHSIFEISNRVGLSTLFRGNMTVRSAMRPVGGMNNIFIIPSGSPPPNPTELLSSARMDQILLEASREVDVVIIDSPPSIVADYQVLSTKVDGVLLVIQPGNTHAEAASAMLEQLGRVNSYTLGVVLNKIPRNSHFYGGYHYYSGYSKNGGYYYQAEGPAQPQAPAEDQPVRPLPPTEPYQPYPARSITHTDAFPVELIQPEEVQPIKPHPKIEIRTEDAQPVMSQPKVEVRTEESQPARPQPKVEVQPVEPLPKVEPQPVEFPKPQRDVLAEMYNAMQSQARVNMAMPSQDIPASREVPTQPGQPKKDFLPGVTPKYSIGKYQLDYTFTENEFGKDDEYQIDHTGD
ncbi:MAG: polysaccharide biosynthesis tyrosine autokinase [Chloroflexi bacterium]|nr:polysaccharide biosynthesis tyrosine autokinase [Chloroflexota bacterium]